MSWALFIGALVGLASVVQGGLNRRIAADSGLVSAVLFNAVVMLAIVLALFVALTLTPQKFPEFFRTRGTWLDFRPIHLIPGVCGFIIVFGIPLAIGRIGATKTFLLMMSFQMFGSLMWDSMLEGKESTLARVLGVLLALCGAALVAFKG